MKSKSSGIYMIVNNINGKIYIGQSKNVFTRWSEHYRKAMLNKKDDTSVLHKAIRKYGIECFWFKVLELCDEQELDEKERFYISLYQSDIFHNNYNVLGGGGGGTAKGSKNHNSKLTEEDVYDIREQYKDLITWREVYKKYKDVVSENTFKDVWTGKTWSHVHMDVYTEETKLKQRNNYDRIKSHKWMQKLSDEDIIFIRKLRAKGYKPNNVYSQYYSNINRNTFNDVWYYHTFKHLTIEVENIKED